MDRRQTLRLVLLAGAACVLSLAGCASVPSPSQQNPDMQGIPAEVAEPATPADPGDLSALPDSTSPQIPPDVREEPEASFPTARSLGLTSPKTTDRLARAVGGEHHLSEDTGWLVLPVPRIVDDLPRLDPGRIAETHSGFVMMLPMPVVAHKRRPSAADDVATFVPGAESPSIQVPEPESAARVHDGPTATQSMDPGPEGSPRGQSSDGRNEVPSDRPGNVLPGADLYSGGTVAADGPPAVRREAPPVAFAPSAGPGSAGSTLRESGPGYPSDATEFVRRYASVDPTSEVVITLPGTGWLYVGREFGLGEADLLGKRSVTGDDEFVFSFSEDGSYGLWFQRQDPRTGALSNERIEVSVEPVEEAGVVASGARNSIDTSGEVDPVRSAPVVGSRAPEEVVGGSVAAVPAPERGPAEDPSAWMNAAEEAVRTGNAAVAADYYRRVISAGGVDASAARRSLFELAMSEADPDLAGEAVASLRAAGELTSARLQDAADMADASARYDLALTLYEEMASGQPATAGLDGIYFRMAQILERPGPGRDLKRSLELYDTIVDRYPLSMHWDTSAARIQYLRRHYFDVR